MVKFLCLILFLSIFFCFVKRQMFLNGERSGLHAGQFSTWTCVFQSHAAVMDAAWSLCPDSDSESSSDVQNRIWPVFNAELPESLKIMATENWPSVLSFELKEFSRLLKFFDDILNCRWWDIPNIPHFSLRNNVLKLFHFFRCSFLADWWTSAHLYFLEIHPL